MYTSLAQHTSYTLNSLFHGNIRVNFIPCENETSFFFFTLMPNLKFELFVLFS